MLSTARTSVSNWANTADLDTVEGNILNIAAPTLCGTAVVISAIAAGAAVAACAGYLANAWAAGHGHFDESQERDAALLSSGDSNNSAIYLLEARTKAFH